MPCLQQSKHTCNSLSVVQLYGSSVPCPKALKLLYFRLFQWHLKIPPLCLSYANVNNYYGPYAYCSLDKGVACTQHIQLRIHTCAGHMC